MAVLAIISELDDID